MAKHALFPFESDDNDVIILKASRHFNVYFHDAFGPIQAGERIDVVDIDYESGTLSGYKEQLSDEGPCRVVTHRVNF